MGIVITDSIAASGGKRFATYCLDAVAYVLLLLVLGITSGYTYWVLGFYVTPFFVVPFYTLYGLLWFMGLWLLYYFITEIIFQRTIGKLITGTMVIDFDGNRPSFVKMLLRTFARVLPFGLILFDERVLAKTLHDRISKTCVVDTKKYKEALQIKFSIDEIGTFAE